MARRQPPNAPHPASWPNKTEGKLEDPKRVCVRLGFFLWQRCGARTVNFSTKERNVDGAFPLSLWFGRGFCVAKSEQYRRFAAVCLEIARNVEDERTRASLLHMAQVWFVWQKSA